MKISSRNFIIHHQSHSGITMRLPKLIQLLLIAASLLLCSEVLSGATNPADVSVIPNPVYVPLGDTEFAWGIVKPSNRYSHVFFDIVNPSIASVTPISASGGTTKLTVSGLSLGTTQLEAKEDGELRDSVDVHVVRITLESVSFGGSKNSKVVNYSANYAGNGTSSYSTPEWAPGTSNPICYEKNATQDLEMVINVEPASISNMPLTILVSQGKNEDRSSFTVNGGRNTRTLTTVQIKTVNTIQKRTNWPLEFNWTTYSGLKHPLAKTSNPLFTIFGKPTGESMTWVRLEWCTTKANGIGTDVLAADTMWAEAAKTTFNTNSTFGGWQLLDGASGGCNGQADFMRKALSVLGIPGELKLVRASVDAGAGNCLDIEADTNYIPTRYLIMDFGNHSWNQFEGCCATAGSYYAVTPYKKAANDYEMLKTINPIQTWCKISGSLAPGQPWSVLQSYNSIPVP